MAKCPAQGLNLLPLVCETSALPLELAGPDSHLGALPCERVAPSDSYLSLPAVRDECFPRRVGAPLLLDLFCGAGGCAVGYYRAGFNIVGLDIKPQPRYPFPLIQADAIAAMQAFLRCGGLEDQHGRVWMLSDFQVIHASPPCQVYSRSTAWRGNRESHPDLIGSVRVLLEGTGIPYVIENVQEARFLLRFPIMLCGSMFGLRVQRHRYFEVPALPLALVSPCQHRSDDYSHDHGAKQTETVYRNAMECHWMTVHEARQAIPPAYTEYLGRQLRRVV